MKAARSKGVVMNESSLPSVHRLSLLLLAAAGRFPCGERIGRDNQERRKLYIKALAEKEIQCAYFLFAPLSFLFPLFLLNRFLSIAFSSFHFLFAQGIGRIEVRDKTQKEDQEEREKGGKNVAPPDDPD